MQNQLITHEMLQSYFDNVYASLETEIKKTLHFTGNEIYGEILYYSAIKLINYLGITSKDHFLDIGSGLGKFAFYLFFVSQVSSVTGIEINPHRHQIATKVKQKIQMQLPRLFDDRELCLMEGNFLEASFDRATMVYLCSTIFSYDLLEKISLKLNTMANVKKIASLRKLPFLSNFTCVKRMSIHCSWDRCSCYIYERKP